MMLALRVGMVAIATWGMLHGQEFDSASIKPAQPGQRGFSIDPLPGRISAKNINLKQLIAAAYHVRDYQIAGGPKWIASDAYDIEAKAPESEGAAGEKTLAVMLQKLLEKRFSLTVHNETKEQSIYVLEPSKTGAKLEPTKDKAAAEVFRVYQRRQVTSVNAPLSYLVDALSWILSRPVVDKTGLTSVYDYKLEWSPDEFQPASEESHAASDNPMPSLSAELQDKIGLRITLQKGPVEIVTIERAEKPTVN